MILTGSEKEIGELKYGEGEVRYNTDPYRGTSTTIIIIMML